MFKENRGTLTFLISGAPIVLSRRILLAVIFFIAINPSVSFSLDNKNDENKPFSENSKTELKIFNSNEDKICSFLSQKNQIFFNKMEDQKDFNFLKFKSLLGARHLNLDEFTVLSGADALYGMFDIDNDGIDNDILVMKVNMSSRLIDYFYIFDHPYFLNKYVDSDYFDKNFFKKSGEGLSSFFSDKNIKYSSRLFFQSDLFKKYFVSNVSVDGISGAPSLLFFKYKKTIYFDFYYFFYKKETIFSVWHYILFFNKNYEPSPICLIKIYN